ncbi:MAG TPA: hypothetical protein VMV18_14470 [bacterium]|nr:hypothetical protein [bacterium]
MRIRLALLALVTGTAAVAACSTTASLPFGNPTGTTPAGSPSPIPSSGASPYPTTISGNVVLNSCFAASASLFSVTLIGAGTLGTSLGGQLLLVMQVTDDTSPRATGDQSPVTAPAELGAAGTYSLVAVNTSITLDSDDVANIQTTLGSTSYATTATKAAEACIVPHFTSITVQPGAQVRAAPWDGVHGGVVAFVADTANILGSVNADADGFPGGSPSNLTMGTEVCGVLDLDVPNPQDGGVKGSGSDGRGLSLHGAGNYLQGGGGGNSGSGGGGGGANGGKAGDGGSQGGSCTNVGGEFTQAHGGAAIGIAPQTRLTFGGGGGGGHGGGSMGGTGGAGGGLIFVSANRLTGNGTITANGRDAIPHSAAGVGQGGGGAGGTIWIRDTATSTFSGTIRANGGNGGSATDSTGSPGGGGGGGRLQISATPASTPAVSGGTAGTSGVGGSGAGDSGQSF